MPNRTLTMVLAVVVALAFGAVVVASTLSGSDTNGAHTMQNGTTMPDEQMKP